MEKGYRGVLIDYLAKRYWVVGEWVKISTSTELMLIPVGELQFTSSSPSK